jgi:hypothetical protein
VRSLDIVEFGPGDSLTSGFSLLAAGASSYTVVDRFQGDYSAAHSKAWYRAIRNHWQGLFPGLPWPPRLDPETFPEGFGDIVHITPGSVGTAQLNRQFDIVCSYQVGEHVDDVTTFAEMTAKMLKPHGVAVHRVDFGPHDCWLDYRDPLTFLRFPDWLWSLMGSNRGYPSRHRHHRVLDSLESAGLIVEVQGYEAFGVSAAPKSRLSRRFRTTDDESLTVRTAIYICRFE